MKISENAIIRVRVVKETFRKLAEQNFHGVKMEI